MVELSSNVPLGADPPTLAITRLHRALEHADVSLTMQQYRVLALLSAGGARAGQLAQRLAVAKPTITSLTDSLVEQGLAARETDEGDRRVVTLSITPAGRAAVAETGAALRAVLDAIVARCADPAAVYAALDQLVPGLDAWWEDHRAARAAAQ
jgi:DNA-binding MarR family transcriptional regulator